MADMGQPQVLVDAAAKAAGRARYLTDMQVAGMAHGAVVRSPHAHARLLSLDASQALRLPGVLAVVGPDDCPSRDLPGEAFYGRNLMTRPLLWREPAFVGCAVAAVLAETAEIARQAVGLLSPQWQVLPHVLTLEAALEPNAPAVRTGRSNIALPFEAIRFDHGDVDAAFAQAAHVLETIYRTRTVQAAALEPYACIVEPTAAGGVVVHKGTPAPYELRDQLATWLGCPTELVRVVVPEAIGGGFGSRMDDLEFIGVLLARKAGRPVRLELERAEGLVAGRVRHGARIRVRSALDEQFRLVARELHADYDAGAHLDLGPYVILRALRPLALYRCAATRFVGRLVATNRPVASATRGFGNPQATFAVESHTDELCRRFGLDPVAWRRTHLTGPGEPNLSVGVVDTETGGFSTKGATISSCAVQECLSVAAHALTEPLQAPAATVQRGRGLAVAMHTTGKGRNEISTARVTWHADGSAEVRSGAPDQGGTGVATVFSAIAAQVLGIRIADVRVVLADTQDELHDSGAHASGRTYVGGEAVRQAAEAVRLRRAQGEPLPLHAEVRFSPQTNAPPFAACAAVVDVDVETGQVRVVRLLMAVDVGRVFNPLACRGQIQGAAVQGLGFALQERLDFDSLGRLQTRGLLDYGLPRSVDVPEPEVVFCGSAEPTLPLGVKGAGEIGLMPVAPAIANAIADACGARVRVLPMDGEAVWHALGE